MQQLKTKQVTTKRLFYKKWLFKVVIECGGMSYLHRRGKEYITNLGAPLGLRGFDSVSLDQARKNKIKLLYIASVLEKHLPNADHQIRVESSTCAVFTNDLKLVEELQKAMPDDVTEVHVPDNITEATFLSANKNKVICNKLPNDGYRFKLYLKDGYDIPADTKANFLKWCNNYNGKIHLPRGTRLLLEEPNNMYFYGKYFYAKDDKIANMALIFLGNLVARTNEYVLKSEII